MWEQLATRAESRPPRVAAGQSLRRSGSWLTSGSAGEQDAFGPPCSVIRTALSLLLLLQGCGRHSWYQLFIVTPNPYSCQNTVSLRLDLPPLAPCLLHNYKSHTFRTQYRYTSPAETRTPFAATELATPRNKGHRTPTRKSLPNHHAFDLILCLFLVLLLR